MPSPIGGAMSFSRDGSRLFLSCAPAEAIAALDRETPAPSGAGSAASPASEEKVLADLWSWKDDFVQPMQKVRAAQERARSYRAVLTLADKKFLQISDPTMAGFFPSDDGRVGLGSDDRAYRHMVDYDGTYSDVYLVDTSTGARKLAIQEYRGQVAGAGGGGGRGGAGGIQLSPDNRHALIFKDKQWWSIDLPSDQMTSLTGSLGPPVFNEDDDRPEEPTAYGTAGWTKDGKYALIYDRYDVWAVSPEAPRPAS
jgi:hypothetical protein